jgi:predicted RNA binding protein YcfA (HicA-like mRNA interferase family)
VGTGTVAFHGGDEIGSVMLAKIAKQTGFDPKTYDLWPS